LLATILLGGSPAPRAEAATTIIPVGDFWFCNSSHANGVCPTSVALGDTVEWDFGPSIFVHTSTDCGTGCGTGPFGGVWDSGNISPGGTYQFTFNTPGVYPYYCTIHPTAMQGEITVTTPVGGIAELPDIDAAPQQAMESQGGTDFVMVSAAAGAAAAGLAVVGVLLGRRLR
jgi:hypothetical protein